LVKRPELEIIMQWVEVPVGPKQRQPAFQTLECMGVPVEAGPVQVQELRVPAGLVPGKAATVATDSCEPQDRMRLVGAVVEQMRLDQMVRPVLAVPVARVQRVP